MPVSRGYAGLSGLTGAWKGDDGIITDLKVGCWSRRDVQGVVSALVAGSGGGRLGGRSFVFSSPPPPMDLKVKGEEAGREATYLDPSEEFTVSSYLNVSTKSSRRQHVSL